MATRRRYKTRQARHNAYAAGGSVPEASADGPPPPMPPEALAEPDISRLPPSDPAASSVLMRAAEAQREAEAMARDPKIAIEKYVDALPGLFDRERELLKTYPMLLTPPNSRLLQSEFNAALAEGHERGSGAFLDRVLSGIVKRLEGRNGAMPPPMPEPSVAQEPARHNQPAADDHNIALPPPPPPMPQRRSIPMSAPVSRDVPSPSGQRVPDFRSMTLSAAERAIARNSFGPIRDASGNLVDMTNEEKEFRYAQNKALMLKRRADGTLNE
jgi:hypothetical protein